MNEDNNKYLKKLDKYYDKDNRLIQYPSKHPMRVIALTKIGMQFDADKYYTEKEVNDIISVNILFTDIELIRREMFQYKFLGRYRDGSKYWLENSFCKFKNLIESNYSIEVEDIIDIQAGVGGETCLVKSNIGKLVFKKVKEEACNHPELEMEICEKLSKDDLPVPKYIRSKDGNSFIRYADKYICHLQTYIEGQHYKPNTAPQWLMNESAMMLGKMHKSLSKYNNLNIGIGENFFRFMTPENALNSYRNSLACAKEIRKDNIIESIEFRIKLMSDFNKFDFKIAKMTYCNTHGDYTINQLICDNEKITGIVDFTCACRHPVIWEIMRSFVYAEPSCKDGYIDKEKLVIYINNYLKEYSLNKYDIENIVNVYYYQIAVCDYYSQYLNADALDEDEFLWQADFATNMLVYLHDNIDELNAYLKDVIKL